MLTHEALEQHSDLELLNLMNEGQLVAFETLTKRREKWLWNVAKQTLRQNSLAEEALQDALLSIWKNSGSFRGESQVSSWMYQIVRRSCIDVLRKERLRTHSHLEDFGESQDALAGSESFEDALVDGLLIHAALLELDPSQRIVITLIELEGLSVNEVSQKLNIPVGTVKSRASRGRDSLRVILEKLLEQNGNQLKTSNVIPLGVKNERSKKN